jgi:hypothetical protein
MHISLNICCNIQFIKFISVNICDIAVVNATERGYIILIAGAVFVVVAGIALTAVYAISLAGLVLGENVILSDVSINSSASVNRTLQITNTERPISIALHIESEKNDGGGTQTQQQQASNIENLQEEVIIIWEDSLYKSIVAFLR